MNLYSKRGFNSFEQIQFLSSRISSYILSKSLYPDYSLLETFFFFLHFIKFNKITGFDGIFKKCFIFIYLFGCPRT